MIRRIALTTIVLAVTVILAIIIASETGIEVVTVHSKRQDGSVKKTRLWIAENAGQLWLRAGVPNEAWLEHIAREPVIGLERNGTVTSYRAVPSTDTGERDRVHALMRDRYGFNDRLISMIRDGSKSIAVRLEPVEGGTRPDSIETE